MTHVCRLCTPRTLLLQLLSMEVIFKDRRIANFRISEHSCAVSVTHILQITSFTLAERFSVTGQGGAGASLHPLVG